jgi:uncharacterized protein (TIGR03067 family)
MNLKVNTHAGLFTPAKILLSLIFAAAVVTIFTACESIFPNPDYEKMQGVWEYNGPDGNPVSFIVEDRSFLLLPLEPGKEELKGKLELISGVTPKQFDLIFSNAASGKTERWRGIYELSDKRIKAALSYLDDKPRPSTFTNENAWLFEWKGKSVNLAPIDPNYVQGMVTWNYWDRVHSINSNNNPGNPFANIQTPAQAIAACNKTIGVLQTMRTDINALPVSGVDTEVTSYVSEYLDTLNLLEETLGEMVPIIKDAQELAARQQSDETLGMAIIDLFIGRPGATINALDAEAQQLKNRVWAVQNKAKQGSADSDRLGTKQLKLRSYLSGKYKREFPRIAL